MTVFIVIAEMGNDDEPRTSVIVKVFDSQEKANQFIASEIQGEINDKIAGGEDFDEVEIRRQSAQWFSIRRINVE